MNYKVMVVSLHQVFVLATLWSGACATCKRGASWWDRAAGACQPCTRCPAQQAVRLPCELHRDTVCQNLADIHLFPSPDYYEYEEDSDSDVDDVWDVQKYTLMLAVTGCVVFFVVVLVLLVSHGRQWREYKRELKADVQDLTAKLKLMEAGVEPSMEPLAPSDHHIYCNIHVAKDALLGRAVGKKGLGNVYTQEKHPA